MGTSKNYKANSSDRVAGGSLAQLGNNPELMLQILEM